MLQLDTLLKRDFFIENLLFHRARKLYFRMVSPRQAYTINQKIRPLTDGGFQGGAAWAAITVALTG